MTERYALQRHDGLPRETPPGQWSTEQGGRIVSMACPDCGRRSTLRRPGRSHDIDSDGTVSPSAVCPHDGCAWHEWIRLEDWPP